LAPFGSIAANPSLSVSVVTYAPDLRVLEQTLSSLGKALCEAHAGNAVSRTVVLIVDNGPGEEWKPRLCAAARRALPLPTHGFVRVVSGHGNVGYGAGHNLAIADSSEHYHLVLNPDVILDSHAIIEAVRFMEEHDDVALVAPAVRGPDGKAQYLCKRYPAVVDLLLRGFAPPFLRRRYSARLERYEMRGETRDAPHLDVPIASGTFMFLRRTVVNQLGGFSSDFFMYFEDFDLSVRLSRISRIAYVPAVKVTHLGGYAAKKGWRHICMFVRSSITFYARHGWKWW
jgi:GT2 family glycosyltransferase